MPDSENNERAVLHAQRQLRSIGAESHTTNGFFHVAAGDQGVVSQAPQPGHKDTVRKKAKPPLITIRQPKAGRPARHSVIATRKDAVSSLPAWDSV